jgi:hypothetical protein
MSRCGTFLVALALLAPACGDSMQQEAADAGGPGSASGGASSSASGGGAGDEGDGAADSTVRGDAGGAVDGAEPTEASLASGPKCGSTPTQLVNLVTLAAETGANYFTGLPLAVDSTYAYFCYDSALMSVPLRGGPVSTLARLPNENTGIALVTSEQVVLFAALGANYAILSVPIAGGSAVTLASVPSPVITGSGADDQNIYFIDQDGTQRVSLDGGEVALITTQVSSANTSGPIVVRGGSLMVATGQQTGPGSIESIPIDGGPPATVATDQPNAAFPMTCGADICWWTGVTPFGLAGTSGPGDVARLAADGGVTMLPGAPFMPSSFVFDGTDFFETVLLEGFGGPLVRIPASGAPVVTMVNGPSDVVVDDTCVYYSTMDGIFSLVKTYDGSELDGGGDSE